MKWSHVGQILLAVAVVTIFPGPQLSRMIRGTAPPASDEEQAVFTPEVASTAEGEPVDTPMDWFASVRDRCTPSGARLVTDLHPPPEPPEGTAYEAACFALAGDIPMARALLLGLPEHSRTMAAGILFDVARDAHDPALDAAAGPLMELVLEFWPNHYLALFYAGSARYLVGDTVGATSFFERFLALHVYNDRWSDDARRMLDTLRLR